MHTTLSSHNELFEIIKKEHHLILEKMDLISCQKDLFENLSWLQDFSRHHHIKEELLIFPHLIEKSRLKEGGPFCVLYYDSHLQNNPSSRLMELTKKQIQWEDHQLIFKENTSAVNIPLEEHQCLKEYLNYFSAVSQNISETQFFLIFSEYKRLLSLHFQKEEMCFFEVCKNCLSPNEFTEILNSWKNYKISA